MNRRRFLTALVAAPIVAKFAPVEKLFCKPLVPVISEWNNYANFSSFAIATSIDEFVNNSAVELGYRASQSISSLYEATFDHV